MVFTSRRHHNINGQQSTSERELDIAIA